jgi:ATP-dependent DNA helicase RecQ
MDRENAEAFLQIAIGDPQAKFRVGQWQAIDALVNHRQKLLVVQRTGWGKSAVYFVSTRILRDQGAGPTLIISPLLALMRNQIQAAERLGIRAETINSSNREVWDEVTQRILNNETDAVLISPERLANDEFVESVLQPIANSIGLFVVDEAHCISDWGHDFRPDYRRLINVLQQMPPNMPVLGTTATANNRVVEDVQNQFGDIALLRGTLVRESLKLYTFRLPDQAARLAWMADNIPELPGTGIVYTLTTRDADQVAAWLNQNNISARAYYSGVRHPEFEDSNSYRLHLEESLHNNQLKALVATTALGMGYDKPDLGFVIHYQASGSVVGYYQQVGRAGRAIDEAFGILLSGGEDEEINEYFRNSAFPSENNVHVILNLLEAHDGISLNSIKKHVNLTQGQIEKVLKYLSVENPAPIIKQASKWMRTPVNYAMDNEKVAYLTQQRQMEWQEVQDYIGTDGCLMQYLREALDDPESEACDQCANCLPEAEISMEFEHARAVQAAQFLRQAEFKINPRKQTVSGAFPEYEFPYSLPVELQAEEGRILCRWGDAGWGNIVKDNKHNNYFGDDLVNAVAEMLEERWRPEPTPEWITCIPSHRHPELVPDFAQRLADRLGIPFMTVIDKIQRNQPQKLQKNSYYQCSNLDGAFTINDDIPDSPVLLVDDIVDSRWTMTVIAALLRRSGSGPVFPVALATSSTGN